ncbi:hypothetical protein Sjap_015616 [Stephania japonica]|uniref:Uncharacterized protein n=1 Tax=Stephania japonica TaxID=461633 RepID=A0AAP0IJG7_9MAGN
MGRLEIHVHYGYWVGQDDGENLVDETSYYTKASIEALMFSHQHRYNAMNDEFEINKSIVSGLLCLNSSGCEAMESGGRVGEIEGGDEGGADGMGIKTNMLVSFSAARRRSSPTRVTDFTSPTLDFLSQSSQNVLKRLPELLLVVGGGPSWPTRVPTWFSEYMCGALSISFPRWKLPYLAALPSDAMTWGNVGDYTKLLLVSHSPRSVHVDGGESFCRRFHVFAHRVFVVVFVLLMSCGVYPQLSHAVVVPPRSRSTRTRFPTHWYKVVSCS